MKNNDNNKEKSLINMLPMGLSGEINEIWVSLTIDKYCLTVQQIWKKFFSLSSNLIPLIQNSKSCALQVHLIKYGALGHIRLIWPKNNQFSLPGRLRPLSILIVDQHDHNMFKSWAAHLCAWLLHLRKLCWHCSVFQNLPSSHPLYSRVPAIDAFAYFSLRPTCSFQTEAEKKLS